MKKIAFASFVLLLVFPGAAHCETSEQFHARAVSNCMKSLHSPNATTVCACFDNFARQNNINDEQTMVASQSLMMNAVPACMGSGVTSQAPLTAMTPPVPTAPTTAMPAPQK